MCNSVLCLLQYIKPGAGQLRNLESKIVHPERICNTRVAAGFHTYVRTHIAILATQVQPTTIINYSRPAGPGSQATRQTTDPDQ